MKKKLVVGLLCFVFAAGLGWLGVQFFTHTGLFKIPGIVRFSESFPDSEAAEIQALFDPPEVELDKDITFSKFVADAPSTAPNAYLLEIYVPTADFYESQNTISAAEFDALFSERNPSVIKLDALDSTRKLLAVDGAYFLDTFASGAKFEYLRVEGESEADLELVNTLLAPKLKTFPDQTSVLTFAQTGVTALARRVNTKLDQVGSATYFSEALAPFLSKFDFTHTSNEASFSSQASGSNICSRWEFVDALTALDVNVVELTGNHNLDCGAQAALDTLTRYADLGIKTVGGGRNAEDAATPLELAQKDTKITFFAYNQSTGGATLGDTPGANQYYPEDAQARISAAKSRGDFVIVDIQYYECSEYDYSYENTFCDHANSSAGDQIGVFRSLIDMGADLVVGTSAHQPQTFERYGSGAIYYGLGNLFFDQSWWPGTTRSLGLVHYFYQGKLLQTRRFGTVYDDSYQTRLMDDAELVSFIARLNEARP